MKKINKSLACPNCQTSGIKVLTIDSLNEVDNEGVATLEVSRRYNCFCNLCQKWYLVDYGKAVLKKYNLPVMETISGDVKLYVSYESEFDRGYKIISIDNTLMIMAEGDKYPIIVAENEQAEIVNTHSKTRKLISNKFMERYR